MRKCGVCGMTHPLCSLVLVYYIHYQELHVQVGKGTMELHSSTSTYPVPNENPPVIQHGESDLFLIDESPIHTGAFPGPC